MHRVCFITPFGMREGGGSHGERWLKMSVFKPPPPWRSWLKMSVFKDD